MANWNNIPAREAGKGDGSKQGPPMKPPTYPPVGPDNPAALSACDMQGNLKGMAGYAGKSDEGGDVY